MLRTKCCTELPKALQDTLEKLATVDEIHGIEQVLQASLENIRGNTTETFELDLDPDLNIND